MNTEMLQNLLHELEYGKLHSFNELAFIPKICAGVYSVWNEQKLIYVGMSGRSMSAEMISEHRNSNSKAKGLVTRLKAHASGRRSGDQFCIYVGDRLVLPSLTSDQIADIANGNLSFDKLIKEYIHRQLAFRFVETENDKIAYHIEIAVKDGALNAGKPFLNPNL